jgi:hypothetical protein
MTQYKNKALYPLHEDGFKAKSILIRASEGGTKFPFQQITEIGLPKNSKILAIWAREHDSGITASNGLKLVDSSVFENAYIALKDRANKTNSINLLLSDYSFLKLTQFAVWMQPIESQFIDWNQSFVRINPRASASDNTVFEALIIYSDPDREYQAFPNRFIFRSGLELSGKRISSFEVTLNSTETSYPLATNGLNVALPDDAIVLGFTTTNDTPPLYGKEQMDPDALKSTYITFKQGTCEIIADFPCGGIDKYDQLVPDLNYFPIVPTEVNAFDWQQSKISIKDNTNITDDMTFQFSIVWVLPFENFR